MGHAYSLKRGSHVSDKQSHLEMIQGIINRLSHNSFLLKGWTVVLVSAMFALAAKDQKMWFIYLAYFPAISFWCLDGYFLWQERRFRALYDLVRIMDDNKIDYSMDPNKAKVTNITWPKATWSKTLIAFHGVIVASIIIVMFICIIGGDNG